MQLKLNELLVWNIVLQKDINMSSQGASVHVPHFEILSAASYITSFRKRSPTYMHKNDAFCNIFEESQNQAEL